MHFEPCQLQGLDDETDGPDLVRNDADLRSARLDRRRPQARSPSPMTLSDAPRALCGAWPGSYAMAPG